jgi:hypothetical protein
MRMSKRKLSVDPRRGRVAAMLLALSLCVPGVPAQTPISTAQIKVALVYNFLKYTEWPGEAGSGPLVLCVVNPDRRIEAAFASVHGRTIDNRPIQVRSVGGGDNMAACHLLYIHDGNARDLLAHLNASQVYLLTVGDQDDFVDAGGAIGLVEQNGRMQFKVNVDVMKRGSYRVSAQLLKLAINTR